MKLNIRKDRAPKSNPLTLDYRGGRRRLLLLQIASAVVAVAFVGMALLTFSRPSRAQVHALVVDSIAEAGGDFPTGQASMWVSQVLKTWGTWDQKSPEVRAGLLAPFLSAGMDPQAGWNQKGTQKITWGAVNPEPVITDPNRATFHAVYQTQDSTWACVAFPMFAAPTQFGWAFALTSNPTPVPCTPRTGAPPLPAVTVAGMRADTTLGRQLADQFFGGFFTAWGSSNPGALEQYTTPGTTLFGLGGAVGSVPAPVIGETTVWVPQNSPIVDGQVYRAVVPVTWSAAVGSSTTTATYWVPVTRSGDRWYVAGEPAAAAQTPTVTGGEPAVIPPAPEIPSSPTPTQ